MGACSNNLRRELRLRVSQWQHAARPRKPSSKSKSEVIEMNVGKPFQDFVQEVQRNADHRDDVVARLNTCRMDSDATGSMWTINGVGEYEATPIFHRSVAETLRIPASYYEDMRQT